LKEPHPDRHVDRVVLRPCDLSIERLWVRFPVLTAAGFAPSHIDLEPLVDLPAPWLSGHRGGMVSLKLVALAAKGLRDRGL
jgi:hypothetical protein